MTSNKNIRAKRTTIVLDSRMYDFSTSVNYLIKKAQMSCNLYVNTLGEGFFSLRTKKVS